MSKLRQAFHQEVTLKGYSERTRESYLSAIEALSRFVQQPLYRTSTILTGLASIILTGCR